VALRPGARILVIEDSPTNLELVSTILRANGYDVISSLDAESGLERARTEDPAVVLMDIGLPGMDGLSAVALLKADARTARIPVVAVTAHALPSDEARALSAGFDAYLAKPVRSRSLIRLVGSLLSAQ
jgi:two-component system cell cycle response regulator DivK